MTVMRTHPPVGYYKALHEGENASAAVIEEIDDEGLTGHLEHWALAAAEPEPTLQQALNGPDTIEWQEAINYKISQLEKPGAWEIVNTPPGANIILYHYVLATKRGPNGKRLKLHARLVANSQQ